MKAKSLQRQGLQPRLDGCLRAGNPQDAASQLRGVKYSVSNASSAYSGLSASLFSEWAYDSVGNRASQTGSTGTTTYSVNDINQYT